MSPAPKSESPAATGQTQYENTNAASISTAEKTGKQDPAAVAEIDCRPPAGCTLFPHERLSRRDERRYLALVTKAAKVDVVVDLVVADRGHAFVLKRGTVERRVNDLDQANRWLDFLRSGGAA